MNRKRRTTASKLPRCVLDSGGLTGLCGRSRQSSSNLRWVVDHAGGTRIPTPILVECTTGDGVRDAEVNRILGVLARAEGVMASPNEETARRAGHLRFLARSDDGIDALVAAEAVGDGSPCVVLTSAPKDLRRLLARDPQVIIRKV